MSRYLEVWYVEVEEREGKKHRNVLGRTGYRGPTDARLTALQTDDLIKKSFGQSANDHLVTSFLPEPRKLPSFAEIRKGQIALAMFKSQLMAEGIRLRPNELRSEIGNKIKTLNEQNSDLNLQFEETLEFVREILEEALALAFKPKSKS